MNSIQLRMAEPEDVGEILTLIKELAEFEQGLHQVTIDEHDLIKHGFGKEKIFECLLAESEEGICGAAIYFYTYSTWNGKCLYLEDLIVKRKGRHQGVGSVLMNELISIAKKNGAKRMAWQVLDWNLDAQEFYRKFDADLDGEWLNGRLNAIQINEMG